ncbi:MAG: sigma-54-dependent Fis family transcriptional regulator [Deltaproteobacteria bacterium HGW-Deltaproteobacteria-16]|nr:MAG: sigma-54-dependent Fis family transcriptional regulator [Deltaproteobacteria bacterium HGW-Deltaproteobacteria-16]
MKIRGRIFAVDDDELIVSMLARALKSEGYEVHFQTTPQDVVANILAWQPDIVFLDVDLAEEINGFDILAALKKEEVGAEVVMLTADDSAESAIRAMKLGAVEYFTKPFNLDEIKIITGNIIENIRRKAEIDYHRERICPYFEHGLVGESPQMKDILKTAEKLVQARAETILVTGESGSGKEVLARYLHCRRQKAEGNGQGPFFAVNCTALPENLIESELFGHAKGAFTDARTDKKGIFELAADGTLLLDEIGDMRLDLQAKLLRVLEERTVRRLGGSVDLPVQATVIVTTNKDLKAAAEQGGFRKDLFFRLSAFAMELPPLRERGEDILLLARHFLRYFANKYLKKGIKEFSGEAEKALLAYGWPGNVRELRNIIERCVVLEEMETITREQLLPKLGGWADSGTSGSARIILPEEGLSLEELEKDLIRQALERTNANQTKAAKLLGISYDTLRYQMKKFGLG